MEDVCRLLVLSARHRHTGQTRMNRESSRSHSVFTCVIQSKTIDQAGIITTLTSRLNLVDLAGDDPACLYDLWQHLRPCCSEKAPGAAKTLPAALCCLALYAALIAQQAFSFSLLQHMSMACCPLAVVSCALLQADRLT